MSRALEGDYQRALLARVAVEFPGHRFFRRNVGLVKMQDSRVFRAGIPGQCDLFALGRGGGHWELEIKRYTGLSDAQERWRDWCLSWGVPWMCVEARRGELPADTIARWVLELGPWLTAPGARAAGDRSGSSR